MCVTRLRCIILSSIPDPIITYPIRHTIIIVDIPPPLSITDTPNAVVPISAPPNIRRAVVTLDSFFPRMSIPTARKNRIIDEIPKLDIPNGLLSILIGKNPCLIIRSIDPSAIWISNKVIAVIASISEIWCM